MHISVIGTGYVGLVTGTCLANAGHRVACVDIDEAKVKRMQAGQIPIYEPGLETIFTKVLKDGRLTVTTSLEQGIEGAEVIFLALPTPPGADGSADLSAVLTVAGQLGPLLKNYTVIVDKSTVPVGTADTVRERIAAGASASFDVVSNPEFLREGRAVEDFMHPDRIVVGTDSERAEAVMRKVYAPFVKRPEQYIVMDVRSAEMTKYAANAFLALKVSFMNEIANLCEKLGADVDAVRAGIGSDDRIGPKFLQAGIGFGGSCFPKDVLALQHTARQLGYDLRTLDSIVQINAAQKLRLFEKLQAHFTDGIKGKHFAVWGLAFKPDTDDIREAPALELIGHLLDAGATVAAYDPEAAENARKHFAGREGIGFAPSALQAAENADTLLIATEWDEFRRADLPELKRQLKAPLIFDGRNMFKPDEMAGQGFYYVSIGRPTIKPAAGPNK